MKLERKGLHPEMMADQIHELAQIVRILIDPPLGQTYEWKSTTERDDKRQLLDRVRKVKGAIRTGIIERQQFKAEWDKLKKTREIKHWPPEAIERLSGIIWRLIQELPTAGQRHHWQEALLDVERVIERQEPKTKLRPPMKRKRERRGLIRLKKPIQRFRDESGSGYLAEDGGKVYVYQRRGVPRDMSRIPAPSGLTPRGLIDDVVKIVREGRPLTTVTTPVCIGVVPYETHVKVTHNGEKWQIPVGQWMQNTKDLMEVLPRDRTVVFASPHGVVQAVHVNVQGVEQYWRVRNAPTIIGPDKHTLCMILPLREHEVKT